MNYQCIDRIAALGLIHEEQATVVDIRDPASFASGHIVGARRLDSRNVADFLATADPSVPVIVCCYHGHSSQGAAQFLAEQGLRRCYSLDGGFAEWRLARHPEESSGR